MAGCLLIGERILKQLVFVEWPPEKLEAERQACSSESHGHRDGGLTGVWCDDRAVVSVGAVIITDGAWRVTPGGVDDRIDALRVHRSDHCIQILGAARVARDIHAGWIL